MYLRKSSSAIQENRSWFPLEQGRLPIQVHLYSAMKCYLVRFRWKIRIWSCRQAEGRLHLIQQARIFRMRELKGCLVIRDIGRKRRKMARFTDPFRQTRIR